MLSEEHRWNILEDYFNKYGFVRHQIESFDQFITSGIQRVISEEPPIVVIPLKPGQRYTVKFDQVYISPATLIEEDRTLRNVYPSEARIRDLTYDAPIYVNITEILEEESETGEMVVIEENVHRRQVIGRVPIMLRSTACNLYNCTPEERIKAGECENDPGGYFIIRGKERVLVGQLRGIYNQTIVMKQKAGDKYKYVAEIRSMSEETGHSVLVQAKIGSDDRTLVFSIPYIKEHIPVGIVFKALGYLDEKKILDLIGMQGDKVQKYLKLMLRDCYFIETQEQALRHIGQYSMHIIKEDKRQDYAWQVVETELFPHLGITATVKEKAYYLGHIVNKLLSTHLGLRTVDNRDHYVNKRVEMAGVLCCDLFRTLFKRYTKSIQSQLDKKKQRPDVMSVMSRLSSITQGLRHSFATGNWGVPKNSYIRTGVSQVLSRLTFGAVLSHLRRVLIPVGKEGKNTEIRLIHPSQISFVCPAETPEGQSAGIVLNLSLLTIISHRIPSVIVKQIIEKSDNIVLLNDFEGTNDKTKVFLNGTMLGMTEDPDEFLDEVKHFRHIGLLDREVSITYDAVDDEVRIYCDEGRLLRPLFTVSQNRLQVQPSDGVNWDTLVEKNYIQYLDNSEVENAVIAMNQKELFLYQNDYCEIMEAMMLGVMASIIPFPDHSQCIYKEEPVYMANGSTKRICDVKVGDEVITFHPETQHQSITKVSHTYTNKTNKQLYELTTISGRKIVATYDHRFMSSQGWCRVEHMIVGKTLVGVSTEQKPVSNMVSEEDCILTNDEFKNNCIKAGIKLSFDETHLETLLPIKTTYSQLYLISRLMGFISTDSLICVSDKGIVNLTVDFEHEHSAVLFADDVKRLGFEYKLPIYSNSIYRLEYSGVFPALFVTLGCLFGKDHKSLPWWIKQGSALVKREFLAGFQGGIGSKIELETSAFSTTKSIQKQYQESLVVYMTEIADLFTDFGIDVEDVTIANEHSSISNVSYSISSSRQNIIRYFDLIGYRYNIYKNIESGIVVEYLKYQQRIELGDTNDLLTIKEWRSLVTSSSTTIFIPLKSKVKSNETIISDITTESSNQSFLCGDTFCVHNSPRNCYQSSMGKQAIGMFALSHQIRTDTIAHVLDYPQRPLVSTIPSDFMGFNDMPSGINAIVAIATYTGFNQEDSVILNEASVQRGLFSETSYRTVSEQENRRNSSAATERICMPPFDKRRKDVNYSLLDENGIIRKRLPSGEAVSVRKGDVVIGKIITRVVKKEETVGEKTSLYTDEEITECSLVIKAGEEGIIDRVVNVTTPNGYKLVKVVIRQQKIPEVGDKFASRAAQKGTCGSVFPVIDMPFTSDGIVPDLIINSHCLVGSTKITMEDGTLKCIRDIYDKNERILTVNPDTLEISATEYVNGFVKMPKRLLSVKTETGCTVKCTPEHMWLVRRNLKNAWVETRNLQKNIDRIVRPLENDHGYILVTEILESKVELVYDFTTISINHSFIANGMVSHNCIPSRMTINQLMECVLGKCCAMEGTYGNSTPFTEDSVGVADKLCERLSKTGFERHGFETLFNGMTGEPIEAQIFIGPTYYQRLKHMVSDKIHARAHGHVTTLTRQPMEGRSRDGGLRFGEMERDCMIAHGVSRFLKERLFDQSDPYQIIICNQCGFFATSPTECKACSSDQVSKCNLPFAAKTLLLELQAMGIKTAIKAKS